MTLQKEHSRLGAQVQCLHSRHEHGLFRNRQATGVRSGTAGSKLAGTELEREAAHTHHIAISGHREMLSFFIIAVQTH